MPLCYLTNRVIMDGHKITNVFLQEKKKIKNSVVQYFLILLALRGIFDKNELNLLDNG